ncbi:GGDEF domain-containing protein [Chelativorans sp. AA-79]|uniref:GGDEF domain-containing protein n=1 Tax=Chelativorans sp. AA-79 TaxID=3028735 RepID=UPI0023F91088|nr:GGDEF domain-containing protein [Chelativorans sp. AA-79]WEX08420.1 GGDEF domain-containing protein [Chelativorans sp. AA-79]
MKFVPPVLFLLFGIALFGLWALERKLRFAMTLAVGFCVLSLAMFSQFAGLPPDIGQNAVISGFLYAASMALVGDGILQRSGKRFPAWLAALYLAGITGGLWYFFYIDRNLIARIYILNFGMGLILLHAAWRARFLFAGTWTDKALLFLLLVSGLHFFPRTLLTIRSVTMPTTPRQFGETDFWHALVLSTSIIGAMGGLCLLAILVVDIVSKLRQERDLDPLTGVLNRRGLERQSRRLEKVEAGSTSVIVVCDLDRFKAINDTYGHHVGDTVLAAFAEIIRQNVRKQDIVARTGGEEFVLVLRDISQDQAFGFSERVRKAVEKTRFIGVSAIEPVTCCFGLARIRPGEPLWASLKRADKALYQAKRAGRNQTRAEWQADPAGAMAARKP